MRNIERCKVLEMTQKGIVTIEEADELLAALEGNGRETAVLPQKFLSANTFNVMTGQILVMVAISE